jgi:hypothetical protein
MPMNLETRNWFDWYVAFGPTTWSQWALAGLATVAAIAAWRTFNAVQKQLKLADDALKISERAWVSVKFDKIYALSDPFVEFDIFNTGKTPGHIKESKLLAFDVCDKSTPMSWTPGPIPEDKMDTRWSIAPGENLGQRWDAKIDGIVNDTKRLTLYGFILYDDIFGKRHRPTFYRIFSATDSAYKKGIFIIPPETAQPGQNEAT